jgi:hypothetical protein
MQGEMRPKRVVRLAVGKVARKVLEITAAANPSSGVHS